MMPMRMPPTKAPGDGADAAENGSVEGLDARHGARGGLQDRRVGAQEHTGDGSKGGADSKRHRDGAVDVDAHELSGGFVLGHGTHCLAHLGLTCKEHQAGMITRQATMVTSDTALTLNLAKNSGTWKVTSEVKFLGVAPHRSCAAFCRK